MKKIHYIAEWNKTNMKKTWSGTTYHLYKALNKYGDVERLDGSYNFFEKVIGKINNKLGFNRNFDVRLALKRSKRLKKNNLKSDDGILIQVGDLVNVKGSFIYQDLSVSSLVMLKNINSQAYLESGFQDVSEIDLKKRMNFQNDIYTDTHILAMSHWLTKYINNDTPYQATYVGGGMNQSFTNQKNTQKSKRSLLFVGRDFHRKGGDIVLEAFKIIKNEYPDATITFVGGEINDYTDGVEYFGDLSNDEVQKLMEKSEIFVMPSRFEAFGLVFLEAMANKMVIIGRDEFEMPWFVSQGSGLLIENSNKENEIQQVADAIRSIFNNDEWLIKAENRSKKIIEENSWSTVATRIMTVIN